MSDSQDNVNKRQHEADGDDRQIERARHEYDYTDIIVVIAAAVTDERWIEGQRKLVRLPEVSTKALRTYIHWAYTGKVLPEIFWNTPEADECERTNTYIEMYLAAEFFDDNLMRVEMVEAIMSKMASCKRVPSYLYPKMWELTPKGSPLRSVMYEWMIRLQSWSSSADNVGRKRSD